MSDQNPTSGDPKSTWVADIPNISIGLGKIISMAGRQGRRFVSGISIAEKLHIRQCIA